MQGMVVQRHTIIMTARMRRYPLQLYACAGCCAPASRAFADERWRLQSNPYQPLWHLQKPKWQSPWPEHWLKQNISFLPWQNGPWVPSRTQPQLQGTAQQAANVTKGLCAGTWELRTRRCSLADRRFAVAPAGWTEQLIGLDTAPLRLHRWVGWILQAMNSRYTHLCGKGNV